MLKNGRITAETEMETKNANVYKHSKSKIKVFLRGWVTNGWLLFIGRMLLILFIRQKMRLTIKGRCISVSGGVNRGMV